MKTNRYVNHTTLYQPKTNTTFHHHNITEIQQEKATLKTLLDSYNHHQHYSLSCNKQLGLYIISHNQHLKLAKHKSKGQLVFRAETLKDLFKKYLLEPQKSIIFKANTHQHIHQIVHNDYQIPKNHFSLCKTTYQGQQESNTASLQPNRRNNFNHKSGAEISSKEKWPSSDRKCDLTDNKKLTIVEQVKQSSQSQAQQSEREQQKQTKYNFSEVHSNFKFNKNLVKKQQPSKKAVNEHKGHNENTVNELQRKPLQSLANMNFENYKCKEQIQQKQVDLIQPAAKQSSIMERNSFGVEIRRGLIQHDSYEPAYENSLKVAGDRQIEKELNYKLNSNEVSQISELSSIISTGRPQTNGLTINNSLKNDIAIIDYESRSETQKQTKQKENPFSKKQNRFIQPNATGQKQQQKVQKFDLRMMTQKREMQLDDNIEITEKQKDEDGQSQFLVKYNLRFLEKKNVSTEVVRLSPLRFRGKSHVADKAQVHGNKPTA